MEREIRLERSRYEVEERQHREDRHENRVVDRRWVAAVDSSVLSLLYRNMVTDLKAVAIMLPTSAMTSKVQRNWRPRRPRLITRDTMLTLVREVKVFGRS